MVLPSWDDESFKHIICYRPEIRPNQAKDKVEAIMAKVKKNNPDEWSLDQINTALIQAGFLVPGYNMPDVATGPIWDCELPSER